MKFLKSPGFWYWPMLGLVMLVWGAASYWLGGGKYGNLNWYWSVIGVAYGWLMAGIFMAMFLPRRKK